jgi:AcrR family transcriptional regulator
MATATATKRKLSTAEERREAVLKAAIPVFAQHGYHAASTMEIAKKAGISQAYVFRLFPTKAELFVAAFDAGSKRMFDVFRAASAEAKAAGRDVLEDMGAAYGALLDADRDVLLMQLHGQVAAGADKRIRDAVRGCFEGLYELAGAESGAPADDLRAWFARGMLCNVMAAMDADQLDKEWARALNGEDQKAQ